jgi:RHS repeat-associated protein
MKRKLYAQLAILTSFLLTVPPFSTGTAGHVLHASAHASAGRSRRVSNSSLKDPYDRAGTLNERAKAPLRSKERVRRITQQLRNQSNPRWAAIAKIPGQTVTLMPDGRWLLMGGEGPDGPVRSISALDPRTEKITPLMGSLQDARAWHSATVLADGTVFVFGGVDKNGNLVASAEIFDPAVQLSQTTVIPNLNPRAHHTATLLIDGRVLIAGGVKRDGEVTGLIQTWDSQTGQVRDIGLPMVIPRQDHTAQLLGDGSVLFWRGSSRIGLPVDSGEVLNVEAQSQRIETNGNILLQEQLAPPFLEASIPTADSGAVPLDTKIALRFSQPMDVTTISVATASLSGPDGATVDTKVVPAEAGMLAFITPTTLLKGGTTYEVSLTGPKDSSDRELIPARVIFTTAGTNNTGVGILGGSSDGPAETGASKLPPLRAPDGVTAISGQTLRLNGAPLSRVLLQIGQQETFTDETGRFLLQDIAPGHHAMVIDGGPASHEGRDYGLFEVGVDVVAARTNVLSYTIWMTQLDMEHAVAIPSPTTEETIIKTPALPGLELDIPAKTVITNHYGKAVTKISITPIPLDQPPFPLPRGVRVPIYFTIQPGGAYLTVENYKDGPKGARLVYPNTFHNPPGTPFDFWNYDADQKGWFIYGEGKVAKDAQSVVPDRGVEIYEFTGAMVGTSAGAPNSGPIGGKRAGEPVDLSTGLFIYDKTDLVLPDVIPIDFRRTYRTNDSWSRPFGIGFTDSYEIFTVGDTQPYTYQELVLPDGQRIHFDRISAGTGYGDAVYMSFSSQTNWYGATISYKAGVIPGASWVLRTKGGTNYYFPDAFNVSSPARQALVGIGDRYGNLVTIARDSSGNKTQITSPNGTYITFQHDSSNRITQATDILGRTVQYTYDSSGRLWTVTDAAGGVWTYTYDSNNNMKTIKDARGIVYLTNDYDTNKMVAKQTQADGGTYQFAWTLTSNTAEYPFVEVGAAPAGSNGFPTEIIALRNCTTCSVSYSPLIAQVSVTDPNSNVHKVVFGSTGYVTSETFALGKSEQQTITYQYFSDNLIKSITDALRRVTTYNYDANANLTSVTQLSGTSNAVTTTLTYEPMFNQIASVTDPLSHTTNFSYDNQGNLTTITDALQHQTTLTYDVQGKALSVADPLGHTTNFGYSLGDLITITDPLSHTTTRFVDAAGRLIAVTDPLGKTTQFAYNNLNQVQSVTDPLNGQITFGYDANGNLSNVKDANNHTVQHTYDNMDRVATRKDALLNQESYQYDLNGNMSQFTDRRGKVAVFSYDGLNRMTFAGYGMTAGPTYESTVNYTYDGGNRLTQAADSISGTITRGYDGLDRLTSETTPGSNTVSYTYDTAGRRSTLTVPGQSMDNYTFDNANRLTLITQGSTTVSLTYDNANRRATLTLPNSVTTTYSFDNASRLTGLTYAKGSTNLGNLTYSYDLNGRRTNVGGSYASTGLPGVVNTTAYNANNQLTTWGTANLFYDANGNMTSDGTHSYTWDARNHLTKIDSGTTASSTYDPFGRRMTKSIVGTSTSFLYDGVNPVQEVIGGTNTANSLSGGTDEVFQRTDSSGARSFLTDALGSTLALTDSTGTAQTSYTFDPFGKTTFSGSSTTNSFAYTGRELDGTGLYYYRARYYSPALQRFISEDPIGFAAGGQYRYVMDNPISGIDPTGLDTQVGIGVSLTLFGLTFGGGGGGSVGISTNGTLSGTSFYGTTQADAMVGAGLYGGVGLGPTFGHTEGALTGSTGAWSLYGEGDVGWGPSAGASGSVSINPDGSLNWKNWNASVGHQSLPGVGAGAALGVGLSYSTTRVSPTLGQAWHRLFGRKPLPPGDCPPENSLACVPPLPF